MATYTADQAAAGYPARVPHGASCGVAFGEINLATALEADDVIELCKLPKGAVPLVGWLQGADIDTGTEALEIDIGTAADPDKYLNSGVITGDAITELKAVASIYLPLLGTLVSAEFAGGLAAEETVIGTVVAAPNAGGTGILRLTILYAMAVTTGA